jgi:hypothetical protein
LHIFISILVYHYKELTELKAQVEQMQEEPEQPKKVVGDQYVTNSGTLDRYFVIKNNNNKNTTRSQ